MTRMTWKAKTSRVNRAAAPTPSSAAAAAYCRAVDNWPRSWMGLPEDVPPGEQLLACFRPFLEQLASSSLSPKTIRKREQRVSIMNQVPFASQDSWLDIREMAGDLAHPQAIGCLRDAGDLHFARRQVDEEQNEKPLQPSPGPHFHGEEIGRDDHVPVPR